MKRPFYKILYVQVLIGIALGIVLGVASPALATAMKPLGDGFIKLVKMIIPLVIFCTVVAGIAGMADAKKVGRVGVKALIYFEVVSTLALIIGLIVGNVVRPGDGFNATPTAADLAAVEAYGAKAQEQHFVDFLLNVIPVTVVDAFAKGDVLQVLLFALLFGFALAHLGPRAGVVKTLTDQGTHVVFAIINLIMRVAPIGAFGAMAFTIGRYGLSALVPLMALIGTFYLTAFLFVALVLGFIARMMGFSIFRFIAYIKEELLIVLGTSSSESALPMLMDKMERLGCSRPVVGLVVPTGYSFNLDGTNIYMTMAALFVAQAMNVDLSIGEQLTLLAVALLTSKGASGITGAGFITLAATLAVVPSVPLEGMALILGIDRFMSECRALTNFIGNGVATVVVAHWEGELDRDKLKAHLVQAAKPVEAAVARQKATSD